MAQYFQLFSPPTKKVKKVLSGFYNLSVGDEGLDQLARATRILLVQLHCLACFLIISFGNDRGLKYLQIHDPGPIFEDLKRFWRPEGVSAGARILKL